MSKASRIINLRVDDEEYEDLRKRAETQGVSIAFLLRKHAGLVLRPRGRPLKNKSEDLLTVDKS